MTRRPYEPPRIERTETLDVVYTRRELLAAADAVQERAHAGDVSAATARELRRAASDLRARAEVAGDGDACTTNGCTAPEHVHSGAQFQTERCKACSVLQTFCDRCDLPCVGFRLEGGKRLCIECVSADLDMARATPPPPSAAVKRLIEAARTVCHDSAVQDAGDEDADAVCWSGYVADLRDALADVDAERKESGR